METVELLIEDIDRLLLPGGDSGEGRPELDRASVAVDGGRIRAVGPAKEIAGLFRGKRRLDGRGRTLTPGFVDSHTHLVFAGDRAGEFEQRCRGVPYERIAAAGGGIRATVRATRAASEDELVALARPRLERMLRLGSTTIEIKSGYGLDLETELRMLRATAKLAAESPVRIVATFMGAHEIPDEYRDDRQGYIDLVCEEMAPAVAREGLAEFQDVFCERGVFTPEESRRILRAGIPLGLRPKVHADELAASGGSEVAAEVGAASADHLMHVTERGIALLREHGVVATLLPGTTFFLGLESYAPARRLLEAGVEVAIATDRNPGSSTIESMAFIVGLSCLRLGLSPHEALRAATAGGARALGLQEETGSIVEGLAADLILWDVPHESRICYEFENFLPRTVIAAGRVIEDRRPLD